MPSAKAGDVVKAAAAKGLKLKAGLVYAVRAADKARKGKPKSKPGRKPGPKPKSAGGGSDVDQTIRRLALTHGLLAVEAAIERLRADAGL